MQKLTLILLLNLLFSGLLYSQTEFAEKCMGTWKGVLYIYNNGNLVDSADSKLIVKEDTIDNSWLWRTEYTSPKYNIVKDYKLIYKEKNHFVTDENNGIILNNYLYGNKLYSIFSVKENILTATYELINGNLIFEVTFGKKMDKEMHEDVYSYSTPTLQRVVYSKEKNKVKH